MGPGPVNTPSCFYSHSIIQILSLYYCRFIGPLWMNERRLETSPKSACVLRGIEVSSGQHFTSHLTDLSHGTFQINLIWNKTRLLEMEVQPVQYVLLLSSWALTSKTCRSMWKHLVDKILFKSGCEKNLIYTLDVYRIMKLYGRWLKNKTSGLKLLHSDITKTFFFFIRKLFWNKMH